MSNSKGNHKRCPDCKMKRRGSNHDGGSHHKEAVEYKEKHGFAPRPKRK